MVAAYATGDPGPHPGCDRLVLLVAGSAPGSVRAREALTRALADVGSHDVPVVEVDVLHDATTPVLLRVFATPALVALRRDEVLDVIYGDLSDAAALGRFLQLAGC